MSEDKAWIEDEELEGVKVKWSWSHFDGRKDDFNNEGDYNFTITLPKEKALRLLDAGWTGIKENDPYEEGEEPEYTMKIKISDRFGLPLIYFLKGRRRVRVEKIHEVADIRRDNCLQLDVIISPSRWINGPRTGVTAYVKEMYVEIKESRLAEKYRDYEEV